MQASELVEGCQRLAKTLTYVLHVGMFFIYYFSGCVRSFLELVGGEVKFVVNSSVCLFLLYFSYINIILSLLSKKNKNKNKNNRIHITYIVDLLTQPLALESMHSHFTIILYIYCIL